MLLTKSSCSTVVQRWCRQSVSGGRICLSPEWPFTPQCSHSWCFWRSGYLKRKRRRARAKEVLGQKLWLSWLSSPWGLRTSHGGTGWWRRGSIALVHPILFWWLLWDCETHWCQRGVQKQIPNLRVLMEPIQTDLKWKSLCTDIVLEMHYTPIHAEYTCFVAMWLQELITCITELWNCKMHYCA